MIECPYADDDSKYTVRTSNGGKFVGHFCTGALPTKETGWWTLAEDDQEERWHDLNPAHIVSVTPFVEEVYPTV